MAKKDYKHIILDTGRLGGYSGGRRVKDDDMDIQQSPMRDYVDRNEFGDRTGPLRRFLHKQVNRPWDKIYSELCEHADYRSLRGHHLRSHIEDTVVMNHEVKKTKDGWRQVSRWYGDLTLFSRYDLFVDDNGILRKPRDYEIRDSKYNRKKLQDQRNKYFSSVSDTSAHVYLDGQWWYIEWAERVDLMFKTFNHVAFNSVLLRAWSEDRYLILKRNAGLQLVEKDGRAMRLDEQYIYRTQNFAKPMLIYPTVKRQLSKKDKRNFGLTG